MKWHLDNWTRSGFNSSGKCLQQLNKMPIYCIFILKYQCLVLLLSKSDKLFSFLMPISLLKMKVTTSTKRCTVNIMSTYNFPPRHQFEIKISWPQILRSRIAYLINHMPGFNLFSWWSMRLLYFRFIGLDHLTCWWQLLPAHICVSWGKVGSTALILSINTLGP